MNTAATVFPPPGAPQRRLQKLRRLARHGWRLMKGDRARMWLYLGLSLTVFLLPLVLPVLFGRLVERLSPAGGARPGPDSWLIYAGWAAVCLGQPLCQMLQRKTAAAWDAAMLGRLRQSILSNVLAQPPAWFRSNPPGAVSGLLREFCQAAQQSFRSLLIDPFLQIITAVSAVVLLLTTMGRLTGTGGGAAFWAGSAAVCLIVVGSAWLLVRSAARLGQVAGRMQQMQKDYALFVQETLKSVDEIRAFAAEPRVLGQHQALVREAARARVAQTGGVERINLLMSLPVQLSQVLLAGAALAIMLTAESPATAGALVSLIMLAPQVMGPVQSVAGYLTVFESLWPAAEDVLNALELDVPPEPSAGSDQVPAESCSIQFEDVSFSYPGAAAPVLAGFQTTFRAGAISGLVARMGAGKSTLYRLIMRFCEPDSGRILLGGAPLPDYPQQSLRRHIGYLTQHPVFTHASVRENLRLACPDAPDSEMLAMLENLGLATVLGGPREQILDLPFQSGRRLSGGQARMFALARVLLRKPAMLLLDEPVAGMDNLEKEFLAARLRVLCAGLTVIIVDHDIHWIARVCTEVHVLEEGRCAQQGSPDFLLAAGGLFQELYAAGGADSAPAEPQTGLRPHEQFHRTVAGPVP